MSIRIRDRNNTLRVEVTMGINPRGSQSSDGVTDWTKKGNKGSSEGVWNRELNTGKRTEGGLVQNKT